MDKSTFIFGEWTGEGAFYVELPSNINSKKDLLKVLGGLLNFPDYYGVNWDAFEECIRDLSWLPEGTVVIKHNDIPVTSDKSSAVTYLEILKDAIAKWSECEGRELVVVFPAMFDSKVMSAMD